MQFQIKAFFFLTFFLVLQGNAFANEIIDDEGIMHLLSERVCKKCNLRYLDLVHADLKNIDVSGSSLEGSNLNNAILDGSKFLNTDLTDVSFNGASLRNANFIGAKIVGTDFRNSDLTGANFDPGSLSFSYWDNAIGIDFNQLSYTELHNAGAESISRNLFAKAELFFDLAAKKNIYNPSSLMALSYTQIQLGKFDLAINNLNSAAEIYKKQNDMDMLNNINKLKDNLLFDGPSQSTGNGLGSTILSTFLSSISMFAQPVFNIPNQFVISR